MFKKTTLLLSFWACVFVFSGQVQAAESIFNETASFQIAKAVKIGRSASTAASASAAIGNKGSNATSPTEIAYGCDKKCTSCDTSKGLCSKCQTSDYLFGNACISCPANATCNGTSTFTCKTGYYKSGEQCLAEKSCSANCSSCNKITGTCSACNSGYCLKNNSCSAPASCYSNCKTCDGSTGNCSVCNTGYYLSGGKCYKEKICDGNCSSCNKQTGTCSSCKSGYKLITNMCRVVNNASYDADCERYCGNGSFYDRPGSLYSGRERVCTKYPNRCGYGCTNGWDITYPNNPYTCQVAQQSESQTTKNADCVKFCGAGFYYDRPGALYGGRERVCTKYPLSCGYNCTQGWDIWYANDPYTCQEALQKQSSGATCS